MFSSTWNRAAIFAAGAMCATAVAQPSYHASWSKVELGAWTLTPVYSEDAGAVLSVDGFLAIADPSTRIGDNIVAVWYERTGAGWSAKSWGTNDPWKAVATVKELMGISDAEDERWDVPSMGDPDATPAVPEEYVDGVLADDPMAALIAASPERDSIILTMTALGYQAADVPVDGQDGCTRDMKLSGFATAIMETLRGDETTVASRTANALLASGANGCSTGAIGIPLPPVNPPTPSSPWVPAREPYECNIYDVPPPYGTNLPTLYCRRERWTDSRVVTQTRIYTCVSIGLNPTISVVVQQRLCTQYRHVECITCNTIGPAFVPPCPAPGAVPPTPVAPMPAGCTQWVDPFSLDCGQWTPVKPCG